MGSSFTAVASELISDIFVYYIEMTHSFWILWTLMIVSYHYSRICEMWLAHAPTDTTWNCLLFVYNGWLHFNTFFLRTHLLFKETTECGIIRSVILFEVNFNLLSGSILTNGTILLGAQNIDWIISYLWNHRAEHIILLRQNSCLIEDIRPCDVIVVISWFHRCVAFEHFQVSLAGSWV